MGGHLGAQVMLDGDVDDGDADDGDDVDGVEEGEHEGVGPHLDTQDRRGQQDRTWGEQGLEVFSWTFSQQFAQVAMFSPAAKAGILPGNTLILINDWKVEAMEQVGTGQVQDPSISSDMLVLRLILLCPSCWRPGSRSNLRGSRLTIHWIQDRGNPCTLCDKA